MNLKIILGLLAVGMSLILFSLVAPFEKGSFLSSKALAVITRVSNESSVNNPATARGIDQYEDVKISAGYKIYNLDSIKTPALGEVDIKFIKSGYEIRLLENSEMLIEEIDSKSIVLILKSGDIYIQKFGHYQPNSTVDKESKNKKSNTDPASDKSIWIRKEGRQLTAFQYALSNDKNLELVRKLGLRTQSESQVLTQSRIEEILSSKRSDFFRCYGQLIQKTEQAHGQVLVSFEISNLGKVSSARLTKSDIEDDSFKNCILEVVSRIQFPLFEGSSITTVFPLKFD